MNAIRTIRIVFFIAIAALVGLMVYTITSNQPKNSRADYGGDFTLQATSGGIVERKKLVGKPYGLFFGYTNCPDFCPTTMQDIGLQLNAIGDAAKDFKVYFITIDPARDTLDLLKLYVSAFDPRIIGLTGSDTDITSVSKSFNLYIKKKEDGANYTFDHTSSVLLFDFKGHWAGTINSAEPDADQIAKIRRLLKG